jgi:anti-sigma regulatory factor (Ser/Thr protein kinase)
VPDELRLPPHPASVGRARRYVVERLSELGVPDPESSAALIVSELVTNAVIHAGTEFTVRVVRAGAGVRVEVGDASPVLPGLRLADARSRTGRGLYLVEHFAQEWGVDPGTNGKVVWFVLQPGV